MLPSNVEALQDNDLTDNCNVLIHVILLLLADLLQTREVFTSCRNFASSPILSSCILILLRYRWLSHSASSFVLWSFFSLTRSSFVRAIMMAAWSSGWRAPLHYLREAKPKYMHTCPCSHSSPPINMYYFLLRSSHAYILLRVCMAQRNQKVF